MASIGVLRSIFCITNTEMPVFSVDQVPSSRQSTTSASDAARQEHADALQAYDAIHERRPEFVDIYQRGRDINGVRVSDYGRPTWSLSPPSRRRRHHSSDNDDRDVKCAHTDTF